MEPEAGQRGVIRHRHRRRGRRLRAHDHAGVRHRRHPVIAVTHIDLRPVEAEAQGRARGLCAALVGDHTGACEKVVARLHEPLSRELVVAVRFHAVGIRQRDIFRPVGECRRGAGMGQRVVPGIALEVATHLLAQIFVHLARLRQRQLHQLDGYGAFEDRLVREDQHALDLALHLRLEIQRQISAEPGGAHHPAVGPAKHDRGEQQHGDLGPGCHDGRCTLFVL